MPGPTTPYIYKPGDNPLDLSNQYGLTPNQLIQANPGGYPFSVGQRINLPYQYSAPIGPALPNITNPNGGVGTTPYGPALPPPGPTSPYYPSAANRGMGVNRALPTNTYFNSEKGAPAVSKAYGTDDSWWRPATTQNTLAPAGPAGNPNNGFGGFENKGGSGNSEYANTAAAQYYAANNTPWLQQKRWSPEKKKYITIGQWLKQGRRHGGGGGGGKKKKQREQNYALANSIIDFGVSAG